MPAGQVRGGDESCDHPSSGLRPPPQPGRRQKQLCTSQVSLPKSGCTHSAADVFQLVDTVSTLIMLRNQGE